MKSLYGATPHHNSSHFDNLATAAAKESVKQKIVVRPAFHISDVVYTTRLVTKKKNKKTSRANLYVTLCKWYITKHKLNAEYVLVTHELYVTIQSAAEHMQRHNLLQLRYKNRPPRPDLFCSAASCACCLFCSA